MPDYMLIDLQMLTDALSQGAMRDLGAIVLQSTPAATNEASPPTEPSLVPSIMASADLVPSEAYKFLYGSVRFLKLYYILERGQNWEIGEMLILSKATAGSEDATPMDESTPPTVPADPTAPVLQLTKNVLMTSGSVGVTLGVMADPSTTNKDMQFGISFQITSATPATFPVLRMTVATEFPVWVAS